MNFLGEDFEEYSILPTNNIQNEFVISQNCAKPTILL